MDTSSTLKGVMFRSKAKWYEEGERNTKYFYNLEKAKYNAKTCYQIIGEEGDELNTIEGILQEQRKFYSKLYSRDKDVTFTMQNSFGVRVPEKLRREQELQLTCQDMEGAIKGMKNCKTPGEDGIPVDFYKVFWTKLQDCFMDMTFYTFEQQIMHQTARKGILNLIPKAGKDTRLIKNLRPITLLNTDYKIIEKAIANKMIPALDHIIHTDQRGFMKNRRISVNIRKMLDIMHQAEKEDLEAVVLSLDFVKCFDKCSFSILHGSLDFFGFGSIIKDWTRILYRDFTVRIQNNGHFSKEIRIEKGVHQGGCCSAVYFLVIAEILALSLRENQDIEGVTWQQIRNLLNQFADDMDIFSKSSEKSIKAIMEELDKFRLQSGFTVSYEKTTMYRIGSLRHSNAEMYNISQCTWSNQDIKVLGVTISHEDILTKNYEGILEKIRKILYAWQNRGLSLIGKVQVVNTLISSLFVYKMMVLPRIPKTLLKNIDNIIREFLWNGGKSKIAYNILQLPKKEGGLNLVNFKKKETALKATWPQILYTEKEYSKLVYKIMRCTTLGEDIWKCSLHPDDIKHLKIPSIFWEDVLRSWSEFNYYKDCRIENQLLWYNSRIRISGKPFYWADLYKNGLVFIHQLFEKGELKTFQQVKEEFGISQLRFNSLQSALSMDFKLELKQLTRSDFLPAPPHNFERYTQITKLSLAKEVYQYISQDVMEIHGKFIKWRVDIPSFEGTLLDFKSLHTDIYKTTNVTKYRSFQYRLLQRALTTNIHLYKWKLAESDLCSFCQTSRETVTHIMWQCTKVQQIWKRMLNHLKERYPDWSIKLDLKNVIFNQVVARKSHAITLQY